MRKPCPSSRIYRVHDELVDHLTRSTPLQRGEALRVIQDVLAYFDETTEDYVRRRHRELQAQGLVNAQIFERIEADLKYRAVAPPELTLRQLRRIVYG
nr:hypothetical protein [Streptomyces sp. S3(2020)]